MNARFDGWLGELNEQLGGLLIGCSVNYWLILWYYRVNTISCVLYRCCAECISWWMARQSISQLPLWHTSRRELLDAFSVNKWTFPLVGILNVFLWIAYFGVTQQGLSPYTLCNISKQMYSSSSTTSPSKIGSSLILWALCIAGKLFHGKVGLIADSPAE